MSRLRIDPESHLVARIGWLRAAVLGANDGIVSTASLIVGVAAATAVQNDVLIAGVAGLVAGAMSMAAGEYVSVSSQADTEQADLARETKELSADDPGTDKQMSRARQPRRALATAGSLDDVDRKSVCFAEARCALQARATIDALPLNIASI